MATDLSDSLSTKHKKPYEKPPPSAPIPPPILPQITWKSYYDLTKTFWSRPHDLNSPVSGDGQMVNAVAGPSHDQDSHYVGEYAASTPVDMDFAGQMANAETGPSQDRNSHSLGDFTAPMQPLTSGGVSHHDNSGNHKGHLERPPSILAESVGTPSSAGETPSNAEGTPSNAEGTPSNAEGTPSNSEGAPSNAEAGSADSGEDESYHDFSDGLDNPVAVQRVAAMVDEMTGLDVATKLVKNGNYETINDLINGLNNGRSLGIKVEDAKETKGTLKKLVRTLEHSKKKVKVGNIIFSSVNI